MEKRTIIIVTILFFTLVIFAIGFRAYSEFKKVSSEQNQSSARSQETTPSVSPTPVSSSTTTTTPVSSSTTTTTPVSSPTTSTTPQLTISPNSTDCEYEYVPYTSCSKKCGGGKQDYVIEILKQPSGGGRPCPEFKITKACNEQPCPGDCEYVYKPYTPCDKPCGGGEQQYVLYINKEPSNGGKQCPTESIISKPCNTTPCPGDTSLHIRDRWNRIKEESNSYSGGGVAGVFQRVPWVDYVMEYLNWNATPIKILSDYDKREFRTKLQTILQAAPTSNFLFGKLTNDQADQICDVACKYINSPMCMCTQSRYGIARQY